MDADAIRRPFDDVGLAKGLQRLVGVDDRKPDRVRDLRLSKGNIEVGAAGESGGAAAQKQEQRQVSEAFARGAPPHRCQMLVQRGFLARGEPRNVEAQTRMAPEQLEEPLALENAHPRFRERFHTMLQGILHCALQSDHFAGKEEVDDLPPAVFHGLVAEQDSSQHGIEMWAHDSLRQHLRALCDIELALLEGHHELDLTIGEWPEAWDAL